MCEQVCAGRKGAREAHDGRAPSHTAGTGELPGPMRYLTNYLTGRWYATRYRSAGTTTSAVSTARPEA